MVKYQRISLRNRSHLRSDDDLCVWISTRNWRVRWFGKWKLCFSFNSSEKRTVCSNGRKRCAITIYSSAPVRDFIPRYIFCMLLGRLIMVRSSSKSVRTHFSWLVSGRLLDISPISIFSNRISTF